MLVRRVPAGSAAAATMGFTDRGDGDFHVDQPAEELDALRQRTMQGTWTWLRQVHGAIVVTVTHSGEGAGSSADAAVTVVPGIVEGVLPATVERMRDLGATDILATIGPCIRPSHYEFGAAELDEVAAASSDAVRSVTNDGKPALDMVAAARVALENAGVERVTDLGHNTADERFHSHRTRADGGRQVSVVRLEANR